MQEHFVDLKEQLSNIFKKKPSHVSPKNHLVNSFIYGIDDNHNLVSNNNRIIHADLGDLQTSEKPQ